MNDQAFALLVGIDEYLDPAIPQLCGCVNDVNAMEQLLRNKFNVLDAHITKLVNEQATYQAIKEAFRQQLIAPAQAWRATVDKGPSPVMLFHFSGHGSQALDETGTEPDGMDETLVCYDSRTPNVYDLKDWELGELITELTEITNNVTIILDSCHSGGGLRGEVVRRIESDMRPQPSQRPISDEAQTRSAISGSGWLDKHQDYVLLAACRDRELAYEHLAQEGDQAQRHGAMSYFLLKALAQMSPDSPLSYRELYEEIREQVNSRYKAQMPQCEGDRDRLVFGYLRPTSNLLLTVVDKKDGLIWVDGGVAHGLTQGSELYVYSPETRFVDEHTQPLAKLTVQRVGAVRSGCKVSTGEALIPLHAHVSIHYLDPGNFKRQVTLEVPAGEVLNVLQARLTQDDLKNYLELVPAGMATPLQVSFSDNQLQILDGAGNQLVAPYPLPPLKLAQRSLMLSDLDELARDLAHLIRYQNALQLRNPASTSALNGKIKLEIKQFVSELAMQQPVIESIPVAGGGELLIKADQYIVIEMTNLYHRPLYFALFEFGYAWDIIQHYPTQRGIHEAIEPNRTITLGLPSNPEGPLALGLPEDYAELHETFKVIATIEEADFEILQQGELKTHHRSATRDVSPSPINQLLALAIDPHAGKRALLKSTRPTINDEWTTTQISFTVQRDV